MTPKVLEAIAALTPTEFENLTYDLVRVSGLKNLVWRTPGADGGRDMEGIAYFHDLTGHSTTQRWYVECKRYSSSVDWPTVWKKIAYADAHGADVLLLSTNSNPSPDCETEIAKWNSDRRRPLVRVWRGYELIGLLAEHADIAAAYGLSSPAASMFEVQEIQLAIGRILQAAHATHAFGQDPARGLEAGSCVNELVSKRLAELKGYGKFLDVSHEINDLGFDWIAATGLPIHDWDDVGLRALLALLRYQLNAEKIELTVEVGRIIGSPKGGLGWRGSLRELELVARWCRIRLNVDEIGGGFELARY